MTRVLSTLTLAAVLAVATGGSALADTQWQRNHPRRAEVNHRLANQDHRIHNEVRDGQISHQQAQTLHTQDHQIRQEERDMASQNGGHITQQEQNTLNAQENAVSHEIGH